jgi:hypothetical protein
LGRWTSRWVSRRGRSRARRSLPVAARLRDRACSPRVGSVRAPVFCGPDWRRHGSVGEPRQSSCGRCVIGAAELDRGRAHGTAGGRGDGYHAGRRTDLCGYAASHVGRAADGPVEWARCCPPIPDATTRDPARQIRALISIMSTLRGPSARGVSAPDGLNGCRPDSGELSRGISYCRAALSAVLCRLSESNSLTRQVDSLLLPRVSAGQRSKEGET